MLSVETVHNLQDLISNYFTCILLPVSTSSPVSWIPSLARICYGGSETVNFGVMYHVIIWTALGEIALILIMKEGMEGEVGDSHRHHNPVYISTELKSSQPGTHFLEQHCKNIGNYISLHRLKNTSGNIFPFIG